MRRGLLVNRCLVGLARFGMEGRSDEVDIRLEFDKPTNFPMTRLTIPEHPPLCHLYGALSHGGVQFMCLVTVGQLKFYKPRNE